jgi:glucose 1-dehydrogenase
MMPQASSALSGKVAVVTGGARGIGRATCVALEQAGATVAWCDLLAPPAGASGRSFQADVSNRGEMEAMFAALDRVDILVNNAAASIRKLLVDLEVEDVRKTWDVILWGTFHCSQLAARRMIAQGGGGAIVTISSVHAFRPFPLSTAYNGAKAAVNQMAATWAVELAPHRIRVNVIEPGWTDTPGERAFYTEQQIRDEGAKLPFGRLARPEEIAAAVRFLVTEDSSYVTGSVLRVDGGVVLPR